MTEETHERDLAILDLVGEVEAAVRSLREFVLGDQDAEGRTNFDVPGHGSWTAQDVRWLAGRIDEAPIAAAIFDAASVAARDHEAVDYRTVMENLGEDDRMEARWDLTRVTLWTKDRFGERRWPVTDRQHSKSGVMTYRMPGALAELWRTTRRLA